MMPRCKKCGAAPEGYMDIDFVCDKRRCGMKSVMNAKETCRQIASEGDEGPEAQRRALTILFEVMLAAKQNEVEEWDEVKAALLALAEKPKV